VCQVLSGIFKKRVESWEEGSSDAVEFRLDSSYDGLFGFLLRKRGRRVRVVCAYEGDCGVWAKVIGGDWGSDR
jgi:hypothetical protein